MMGRDFDRSCAFIGKKENNLNGFILKTFLVMLVLFAVILLFLLISNTAQAGDYGVEVQYNIPPIGTGNVTPDVDYTFTVDITNTGTLNPGEDINLTVELDAASSAAGWTVTPSGLTIIPNLQMGVANTTSEIVTVRAPSNAKYQDSTTINVSVDVIGHKSELGCQDSLQLRANVVQVFGVIVTTTLDNVTVDPGASISFEIKITNQGNGNDTFSFSDSGLLAGVWSESDVNLEPDEFVIIYYNLTLDPDQLSASYIIELNATSTIDASGLTNDTLLVTVNIKASYGLDVQAFNNETNKETMLNTNATYLLIITNLGNTQDKFYIGANEPHSQLVSFDPSNITLNPGQSGIIFCSVYADQTIVEANNLFASGIPSSIRTSSSGNFSVYDTISLDTDITVVHALTLSSPDPHKNVEPGDVAQFILNVQNTGTTSDKYVSSIVSFDTSALDTPTFNPPGVFPSSPVSAGTSTPLEIYVDVLITDPMIPAGEYYVIIRISVDGFPTVFLDYNFTVQVDQVYVHTLDVVDDQKNAEINQYVDYTLTLKNTGNGPETFMIRATGEYSNLVVLELTEVTLNQSESIDINAQVYTEHNIIDKDFLYGTFLITPIEAVSKNDPNSFSIEVPLNTYIEHIHEFNLNSRAAGNTMEALPGETIFFTLVVDNTGTVFDQYTFNVVSYDATIFDSISVNDINTNVNPGASIDNDVTITIVDETDKALTGTYDITIRANSKNNSNLNQEIVIHIQITAKAALDVGASQTADGEPGDVIDYKFRVTNMGNAMDTFDLTLEGTNKDWGEIYDSTGTTQINEITMNAYKVMGYFTDITVRVIIPGTGETEAGTFYPITFKVTSRTSDTVSESRQATTEVLDFVELRLDYIGSGPPRKDYDPNQKAPKFSIRITNYGNEVEEDVMVFVDPADWSFTPADISGAIDPGATTTFSLEFSIPTNEDVGEYEFNVWVRSSVDPEVLSNPLTITINITIPDLSISPSDVMGLDDINFLKGKVGNAVTISADIHNIGTSEAKSILVKLYEDDTLKDTKTISSIAANSSKRLAFKWTVVNAEVEIKIVITPQEEMDLGNNEITPIFLDLRPDLSFDSDSIILTNSTPEAGDKIELTASILNQGGNAGDVKVGFYHGTDLIGVSTLDIGYLQTGLVKVEWVVSGTSGDAVTIIAKIEMQGAKGNGSMISGSLVIAEKSEDLKLEPQWFLVAREGETFSYTVTTVDTDSEATLTFSDDTDLFDIDSSTGNISFVPSAKDVGTHVVTISVSDDEGKSDSTEIAFTIFESDVGEKKTTEEPSDSNWILYAIIFCLVGLLIGFLVGKGRGGEKLPHEEGPGSKQPEMEYEVDSHPERNTEDDVKDFPPPPPPPPMSD
jgi:hypothetical protein